VQDGVPEPIDASKRADIATIGEDSFNHKHAPSILVWGRCSITTNRMPA
jgi:hypothetical protein